MSFFGYHSRCHFSNFHAVAEWYMYFPRKYNLLYEKYKSAFASNNYLIVDQPFISKYFPTSGYVHDFLILNKKAFFQTVEQHIHLFHERLGAYVTAEKLWEECQSGRLILCDILKEDELLWGILLGFGKHNAQLYVQGESEMNTFDPKYYFIDLVPLPGFLCDNYHTETENLKKSYEETQRLATEVYNSPDFLDIILKKLKS